MLLVALISGSMLLFCIIMMIKPTMVSSAVLQFCHWQHFHRFEIISRAVLGLLFALNAKHTATPLFFYAIAVLLSLVACGLMWLGERRHREVGQQTVELIARYPRSLGALGIVIALGLWRLV